MFFSLRRIIVKRRIRKPRVRSGQKSYKKYKEAARALVHARLLHFNTFYNFPYKSVRIKNQKTRWGSCSKNGNLNFNYKLALIPLEHTDYIIVHELCHLKEFNHSKAFWNLVGQTIPEYQRLRNELKRIRPDFSKKR